jgi:hypothetical protein
MSRTFFDMSFWPTTCEPISNWVPLKHVKILIQHLINKIYAIYMIKCTPNFEMKSHESTKKAHVQRQRNIKENQCKNAFLLSIIEPRKDRHQILVPSVTWNNTRCVNKGFTNKTIEPTCKLGITDIHSPVWGGVL